MLSLLRRSQPSLPAQPLEWTSSALEAYLSSLKHSREQDRERVRTNLQILEGAMRLELRGSMQVNEVLTGIPEKLPVQLAVYRHMHDFLRIWLH